MCAEAPKQYLNHCTKSLLQLLSSSGTGGDLFLSLRPLKHYPFSQAQCMHKHPSSTREQITLSTLPPASDHPNFLKGYILYLYAHKQRRDFLQELSLFTLLVFFGSPWLLLQWFTMTLWFHSITHPLSSWLTLLFQFLTAGQLPQNTTRHKFLALTTGETANPVFAGTEAFQHGTRRKMTKENNQSLRYRNRTSKSLFVF